MYDDAINEPDQPLYDDAINEPDQPLYDDAVNEPDQPLYDDAVNEPDQPLYDDVGEQNPPEIETEEYDQEVCLKNKFQVLKLIFIGATSNRR